MPDREQREKRRSGKSPSRSPEPFRFQLPEGRPTSRCSVPAVIIPDVFISPTPCPTPEIPTKLVPGPLSILNDELTLSCSDVEGLGPFGEDFTLDKGVISREVYFTEIEGITPENLDRIARLTDTQLATLAEPSTTVGSIVQLTGMKESQAEAFQTLVETAATEVAEETVIAASVSLDCVWRNEERTVACPEGAIENPAYPGEGVNNPVIIGVGTTTSSESQEAANERADELAELDLGCVWGNDELTLTCLDVGFTEAVPVDTELQGNAQQLRIGTITVAANTYFSTTSKADANAVAEAQAELSLACFYINDEVIVDCEDEGFPGTVDFPVNAADSVSGSPVTVPRGLVSSPTSTSDANEAARELGLSLMDCFWTNVEKSAACPSLPLADDLFLPPHDSSPAIAATVSAGEIISRVSQEDADNQAQIRANLLLRCIYCNLQVDPECLPPDVVDPDIPIPIEDVESHWSTDATLGVAEGTFCGDDSTVQTLSETVNFPAKPVIGACAYENDEVVAGCIADEENGIIGLYDDVVGADLSAVSQPNPHAEDEDARTITLAAGVVSILDVNVPPTFLPTDPQRYKKWANLEAERLTLTLLNCFFGNDEYSAECDPDIDENPVHADAKASAVVPQDFFQSYSSKAEADAQAETYGESLLNCFWMNEEITTTCEVFNPNDDGQYHPSAITSITIPANTYISYISLANANFIAQEIAEGGLNCLYTNVIQDPDECPEGTDSYGEYPVLAGTTVSVISGEDADLQAKALANASRVCLDPTEVGVGPVGPPGEDGIDGADGQDGAQSNCDGECIGIFA